MRPSDLPEDAYSNRTASNASLVRRPPATRSAPSCCRSDIGSPHIGQPGLADEPLGQDYERTDDRNFNNRPRLSSPPSSPTSSPSSTKPPGSTSSAAATICTSPTGSGSSSTGSGSSTTGAGTGASSWTSSKVDSPS